MDKFLDIINEIMEAYLINIKNFYNNGDNIIDFCRLPFEHKGRYTNYKGKQELLSIINRVEYIQKNLSKIKLDE